MIIRIHKTLLVCYCAVVRSFTEMTLVAVCLRHGRIQTGGTGGTCPLQTNGQQKWSDRFGFVSLAS